MSTMHTGVIKSFGAGKGFGFIGSEELAGDVFFQVRDLPPEVQSLDAGVQVKGAFVAFNLHYAADGKPQARGIQVIVPAPAREETPTEIPMSPSPEGRHQAGVHQASPLGARPSGLLTQQQLQQLQRQHLGAAMTTVSEAHSDIRFSGQIKTYNESSGYGFISCGDLPTDSYFQKKDVPVHLQGQNIVGAAVTFVSHMTEDSKLQARDLRIAGGAGGAQRQGPVVVGVVRPVMMPGGMPTSGASALLGGAAVKDGAVMNGTVKMCDATRGFGFISAAGVPSDVYFKIDGTPLTVGQTVAFTLKFMRDGKPQAHGVAPSLAGGEVLEGTIKSFSEKSGYGFLSVPDSMQDIYFKRTDLPADLQASPAAQLVGQTVQCSIALKPDGKPAARNLVPIAAPAFQGQKRFADAPSEEEAEAAKRWR